MSTIIAVPSQYVVFKVPDETFELLPNGMKALPPLIVLEVMVANGQAEKLATIGSVTIDPSLIDEEDYGDDPPEGAGPWVDEG